MVERGVFAFEFFDDADGFGEAALDEAEVVVHLEAAVFGLGVSEGVEGVGVGLGEDVGDAPRIAEDFNFLFCTG